MSTHFLVVDDVEANRRLVRRLIQDRLPGSHVAEAHSGRDALEFIASHSVDIVVLDVLMPDMDGFEVCRQIKSNPATCRTLVLMISGYLTDSRSRISGLHSGADSYICKPFESDEFVAQLSALERIRQTEKALTEEQERLLAELKARKVIEKQLEAAKQAAEAAVRAKGEFLAHMSHEIRTPMNAVIGMTEILLDSTLNAEQRECVETIHTASETLLMVINDILDHSKIESGKLTLESRPFDLVETINDAVRMSRSEAESKGLRLTVHIQPDVPLQVVGDTIRLRQILSNLLSNAVKFTETGRVDVEVSACRVGRASCEVHVGVRDTGPGIPASKMNRLFQPFSQLDDSTTRRFGGTGLGLIISKRLAELMQGSIEVESEEGRGSVFHVRVVLGCESSLKAEGIDAKDANAFAGKRVWIVSSDKVERRELLEWASSWGMDAGISETVDLEVEAAQRPDVVIFSDAGKLDATTDGRQYREKYPDHVAYIVLLHDGRISSGSPLARVIDGIFAARLQKPVDQSSLFDVLHALLQRPLRESPPDAAPEMDLDRRQVLVAEDNPVNRKVIEYMLKRLNCKYDFAEDGRAAVAAARDHTYDLILMDVQMPHMDGVEAMQVIRKEAPPGVSPFIVALTAHAMQGDREKYIAAGMDDYISKPLRERELERVLKICTRRKADRDKSKAE